MEFINQLLDEALSDDQIKDFFHQKVNILKFSELKGKTIDEILGKYKKCIILIEQDKIDTGHWCLLHIVYPKGKSKYLEWFDSYGCYPSSEFNYIPKSFQKISKQDRKDLIELLLTEDLPVHYSQYRLQKLNNKKFQLVENGAVYVLCLIK